jgi:hypothetical protein
VKGREDWSSLKGRSDRSQKEGCATRWNYFSQVLDLALAPRLPPAFTLLFIHWLSYSRIPLNRLVHSFLSFLASFNVFQRLSTSKAFTLSNSSMPDASSIPDLVRNSFQDSLDKELIHLYDYESTSKAPLKGSSGGNQFIHVVPGLASKPAVPLQ